jgi:uncharacterized protein (DUF697 family)
VDDSVSKKISLILLVLCIASVVMIIPYSITIQGEILQLIPLPLSFILLLNVIQNTLLYGVFIFFGMKLSRKVGLNVPILEGLITKEGLGTETKRISILALLSGLIVGFLILGIDLIFINIFENIELLKSYPGQPDPELWQIILGLPYGAIAEEVAMRFFTMTLLLWLFTKSTRNSGGEPRQAGYWFAIIIAAILFGASHLPTVLYYIGFSAIPIFRIIFLNSLGGIVFGWLYWKYGIEYAMISHFGMDFVLHVLLHPFI